MTMKIIITGNIGSGKSSFVRLLKEKMDEEGVEVEFVDVDDLVSELYDLEEFNDVLYDTFGFNSKEEIAALVFGENGAEQLLKLQSLVEPYVDRLILAALTSNRHIVLEIPYCQQMIVNNPRGLMGGVRDQFRLVNVMVSDPNVRFSRVQERAKITHPSWTDEMIKNIMSTQLDDYIMNALSDDIVYNDEPEEDLKVQVTEYFETAMSSNIFAFVPRTDVYIDYGVGDNHNTINRNIFRLVSWAYKNPSRTYHNINHIDDMFESLERSNYKFKRHPALLLAILFHDYVYDPLSDSNEQDSIVAMRSMVEILNPEFMSNGKRIVDLAVNMIQMSKHHTLRSDDYDRFTGISLDQNFDFIEMVRVFMDLDLLWFSEGFERVVIPNDFNIREEYSAVSDNMFNEGRLEILRRLHDQQPLLTSAEFGTPQNNTNAKNNLAKLIALYEDKVK